MINSKDGFAIVSKLLADSIVWGGLPTLANQSISVSNAMARVYDLPSFKYESLTNNVISIMVDSKIDSDGLTLLVTGITVIGDVSVKVMFDDCSQKWIAMPH